MQGRGGALWFVETVLGSHVAGAESSMEGRVG